MDCAGAGGPGPWAIAQSPYPGPAARPATIAISGIGVARSARANPNNRERHRATRQKKRDSPHRVGAGRYTASIWVTYGSAHPPLGLQEGGHRSSGGRAGCRSWAIRPAREAPRRARRRGRAASRGRLNIVSPHDISEIHQAGIRCAVAVCTAETPRTSPPAPQLTGRRYRTSADATQ